MTSTPPYSGETCRSSKSSMLMPAAPSVCVMRASTPGLSGTRTRIRFSIRASVWYACSSVRQVAGQREDAVVRGGVEADRVGPESRDETLDELDARGVARRERGEEPGRPVEEIGRRACGTAARAARHRMPRHEPHVVDPRR